ncbi:MAG: hypothetical protein AABZ55_05885, partial [Bdellovibrionota bacterium]
KGKIEWTRIREVHNQMKPFSQKALDASVNSNMTKGGQKIKASTLKKGGLAAALTLGLFGYIGHQTAASAEELIASDRKEKMRGASAESSQAQTAGASLSE